MLLYSPNWLFLYPGLTLMLLGLGLFSWLFSGPQKVIGVTLDVHTMIFAALAVLIGYQSMVFSIVSKTYAINARILPSLKGTERFEKIFTLERGIVSGVLLTMIGLSYGGFALYMWSLTNFGPLDLNHSLRSVITSLLLVAIGIQTILSSFIISLLGLKTK